MKQGFVGRDHAHARRPMARRLSTVLALILALAVGSPSQPAWAQGTGPGYKIQTRMETSVPRPICVGDSDTIDVRLLREITIMGGIPGFRDPQVRMRRTGIRVSGESQDAGIAAVQNSPQVIGFVEDRPGSAGITYNGVAPGDTNLVISTGSVSKLDGEYLDTGSMGDQFKVTLPIKIRNCDFKVTLDSFWEIPGDAEMRFTVSINQAPLTASNPASTTFDGEAKVQWTANGSQVEDCDPQFTIATSDAHLEGTLDETGTQLTVRLTFKPAKFSMDMICIGESGEFTTGDMNVDVTPQPLTIVVPVKTGGSKPKSHVLIGPGNAYSVSSTFTVTPVHGGQ